MGYESQFLIPNGDLPVVDPISKLPMKVEGEYKPWIGPTGRYWRRRVRDGDVHIGSPKKNNVTRKASYRNYKEEEIENGD